MDGGEHCADERRCRREEDHPSARSQKNSLQ